MSKTIPLTQFEQEGSNVGKVVDKVKEDYKQVLDIMAMKIEDQDILKIFHYVMKEHPSIFVEAYKYTCANKDVEEDPNVLYDVYLEGYGAQKIQVIKAIREITGFGLKDAKDIVEGPMPHRIISRSIKTSAESYCKKIIDAGGRASIKEG